MWFEIDLKTFDWRQSGFTRTGDGQFLYASSIRQTLHAVSDLATTEHAVAIEINPHARTVTFGRDYLGLSPLLYALTPDKLLISDEYSDIRARILQLGAKLSYSPEAIALYFAMGYVPQGMTPVNEISSCRNAARYQFRQGKIHVENIFTPIEPVPGQSLSELALSIEDEVRRCAAESDGIDVWCSGGLDSSILAHCMAKAAPGTELLTLGYSDDVVALYGDGETRFVREMAEHCRSKLRYTTLDHKLYNDIYARFAAEHIGPVIDYCAPAKDVLARATRKLAITGEGGDPLFSGVKNNSVLYLQQQKPDFSLGWIYMTAHNRLSKKLPGILAHGRALQDFAVQYFEQLMDRYPGDLVRKLFYLNTFEKQGGMIFPTAYYAAKRYAIQVRHPLTSLGVYNAAFRLPDSSKYRYPLGKLALIDLYKNKLPPAITERKKSGTRLYLDYYVARLPAHCKDLSLLRETGLFNEQFLDRFDSSKAEKDEPMVAYAVYMLNSWLMSNGDKQDEQPLPVKAGNFQ